MIDLESLSVTFGEGKHAVRAVDRVSFHVARGSAFGPDVDTAFSVTS